MLDIDAVSQDDIRTAAERSNLDEACAYIQKIIGQTDNGVAWRFFSEQDAQDWAASTKKARMDVLFQYLVIEQVNAGTGE